ncbi:2-oxo-4-hydroxy-4-carboxy-5-ureidoimidazoline decarboxylase [Derxia gummosa]|uniref:2-oxo-4-hydroxy-4-carboxy-5-ureidoimidazoline decarboxylase n=1 Tax=Derxia gummosa DSM 723 TaxID=1121388 RepID=A0A8B6X6F0_9BURK|nr:2-oxo-4-hydroxy-4-carboxy-5-ureidoimidazoline decarboxylase [Derxia gummosa]
MDGLTLATLNTLPADEAIARLTGLYEHSPWVVERALKDRPFQSVAQFKAALARAVRSAPRADQVALVRAHPELAGRAAIDGKLTAESTGEQHRAGLTRCTPEEFARLHELNAAYNARFGWPFILAVRGAHGRGLTPPQIIGEFESRLDQPADIELGECLRQIDRIAELRLNDLLDSHPARGLAVLDLADELARHSDSPDDLTVMWLTEAHRAAGRLVAQWMRDFGFDEVREDAVGNIIGRYRASLDGAPVLLTGSHFDTVRNAGRYDGRLGFLAPMVAVRELAAAGKRLPFDLDVIAFADEEGVRFGSTFLGSSAVAGQFDARVLDARDAQGMTGREAMLGAGLDPERIAEAAYSAHSAGKPIKGFVEIHIEQGPVLLDHDLPVGVVTSINGSVRYRLSFKGLASHAGTTPMGTRRDAALAAAEFALAVEKRCARELHLVGTVGILEVPGGSINVVPGNCDCTLDVRAPGDAQRDAAVADLLAIADEIAARRNVTLCKQLLLRAAAAPCDQAWQDRWAAGIDRLGLPVFRLPSGAGHDAMRMADLCPQAMLFVRCGHNGISHHPLEMLTADDAELAVTLFLDLLDHC